MTGGFQVALVGKNPPANVGHRRGRFSPWVGKIPWRRAWQLTPVFLPEESHGPKNLAGYSLTKSQTQLKWLSRHTWNRWLSSLYSQDCCCASSSFILIQGKKEDDVGKGGKKKQTVPFKMFFGKAHPLMSAYWPELDHVTSHSCKGVWIKTYCDFMALVVEAIRKEALTKPTCSVCHRVAGERKRPKPPTEIGDFQAYPLKRASPILDGKVSKWLSS